MVLFLLCHIATRRWRNTMIQPLVKRSREKGGHQRFCVNEWCEKRILVSEIRRCYLIRYVILIFGASLAAARDKYAGWPLPISPPPIGDIPLVPFFTPNATFERPPRVKCSEKKKDLSNRTHLLRFPDERWLPRLKHLFPTEHLERATAASSRVVRKPACK